MFNFQDPRDQINQCLTSARGKLITKSIHAQKLSKQGKDISAIKKEIDDMVQQSLSVVEERKKLIPVIEYPDLPITERVTEIKKVLNDNQVVIIAGETGSGKSTQLPKICLDLGLGARGLIGHTQPRRLAARSVANRLAEELKTQVGDRVGFKVRFTDGTSESTLIKLMTDGILLAEIQNDRYLSQYDTIIIDEAHERSLNIDFLLGYLKQLLPKRPDLKVIVTSATIDLERFSKHFDHAPVIEVSGRTYPVEMRYNDYSELYAEGMTQSEAIEDTLNELAQRDMGDVLVFFATEREIHETSEYLRKRQLRHTEVLSLYARLSNAEQQKIFSSHTGRRVILSTNVAETSLTVPGIRYVIDPGTVRISRYSYRTKVQRLPIEPISQASANQRAGRCGRVAPGVCVRLYSEEDFQSRSAFTDPEIKRTNLASVILQMEALKLGKIEDFPFLEKPDSRFIKDGYRLLHELKALDERRKVLPLGKTLARLPIDPKLARMLAAANDFHCLREMLVIVSFLSVQDPREIPQQFQEKARECHRQDWVDAENKAVSSDFMVILNLWDRYHREQNELSNNQMRRYCQHNFLSVMKMREWRDIYRQLKEQIQSLKWTLNKESGTYEAIHTSLATGLLSYIGFNHELKEYLGARGIKFFIFPGSSQFKSTPKWMITSELVETTKLYARNVARIAPEWLEKVADHLVKKHYSEPYWSKKQANVMATMRVSLYGLDIVPEQRITYSNIDPVLSREIFIRHALVYGEFQSNAEFYRYNLALLEDVETLEHKSRRRDVLVDDETLYAYYDKVIPEQVFNGVTFNRWVKTLSTSDAQQLFFEKEAVMQHEAKSVTENAYPDVFQMGDVAFPLTYHFEPGAKDDGVTICVPAVVLAQLSQQSLEWLVPGMLEDKVIALMRALPKPIRKACVPIPHYAKAVCESIEYDVAENFYEVLVKQLIRITGTVFDESVWHGTELDAHLKMNIQVIDERKKVLAEGRDLSKLKRQLEGKISDKVMPQVQYGSSGITSWDFGELESSIVSQQHGLQVKLYPCLVDAQDSVELKALANQSEAHKESVKGIIRLLMLSTSHIVKALKNNMPEATKLSLLFAKLMTKQEWQADFLYGVYQRAFHVSVENMPRNKEDFDQLLAQGRADLISHAELMVKQLLEIMESYQILQKKLVKKSIPLDLIELYKSIQAELGELIYPGFIQQMSAQWFGRIKFYLQAFEARLEKVPRALQQDRVYVCEIDELKHKLQQKCEQKNLSVDNQEVETIRWLMRELWISWYAQNLKTIETVSIKRIEKMIGLL